MKSFNVSLFLIVFNLSTSAQGVQNISGNEMDFWVGEWDLTWHVNEKLGTGHNSVTKTLGGAVIHEQFRGIKGPYGKYLGESFTTFNPRIQSYFQTWVDMNGDYLTFSFKRKNGKYIFESEDKYDLKANKVRMVFYDIKPNSFTWDWQRFNVESEKWILQWRINYQRKDRIAGLNIDDLNWITGRWENTKTGDYEVWEYADKSSSLKGYVVSYNKEGKDSTVTEQLQIIESDGKYIYIAHPISSNKPTEFPIISATEDNFIAYNPVHDFPKRIEYHKLSNQFLKAIVKDSVESIVFEYEK